MSEPRVTLSSVSDQPATWAGTVDAVREAVAAIAVARMRLDIDKAELAQLDTAVEELHVVEEEMTAELAVLQSLQGARTADRRVAQLMVGAVPVPLFVTNSDGAVLDATAAAAEFLHIHSGDLRRKPLFAFMAAHSRRCGRTLLGNAVRTGDVVEGRIDIRPREGEHVPCHVTVVPDPATGDGHLAGSAASAGGQPGEQQPAQLIRWLVRPLTAGGPDETAYRAAVVALCALGVAAGDTRSQLKRVAELASDGIPTVDAASVLLGDPAEPELVATSSAIAQAGDGLQHLAANGPTFEAYRSNLVTGSSDLCEDRRLGPPREPELAGVHSCRAFPLAMDGAAVGVLTLYACEGTALSTDHVVELARPFVVAAQALVRDARAVAEIVEVRDQLQEALRYRGVIEQAKGMIMLARGCTADEAFAVLVRMSNVRNVKLRDVAQEFVASGGRLERGKPDRPRTDRTRNDRFSPPRSSRSVPRKPPAPPA